MSGFFRNFSADQRGAAIIEFAISVPVLFLIIFAIFDFAKLTRESNIVIQATHSGARSGAALASPEKSYWCAEANPKTFTHNCSEVLEWPIEFDALGSSQLRSLEGGLRLTCTYLRHAGFNPRDWTVSASGPIVGTAEGVAPLRVQQRGIKVSLAQATSQSRCITCYAGLFSSFFLAEESYFAFQFVC